MFLQKSGRETGDVLFQGYARIDCEKTSKGEDEDFGNGVIDRKHGVGDGTIFVGGGGRQDAVGIVMLARPLPDLWVQGDGVCEVRG